MDEFVWECLDMSNDNNMTTLAVSPVISRGPCPFLAEIAETAPCLVSRQWLHTPICTHSGMTYE